MIDQAANLAIVLAVGSWILGAVVLYVVVRLAVTHAIRATRPSAPPAVTQTGHQDADGL